ncbi:MAG TPA: DUF3109 family protein [Saprospiraceae bacterium]|nr:DUF3109 family protein [Saprospiraceae bacterium]
MILIQEILVSSAVVQEQFVCHLERCQGACCVGGDYGAPIDDEEIPVLTDAFEAIKSYMEPSGVAAIEKYGVYQLYDESRFKGVTLREDMACAFARIDVKGIAHCTIEEAWQDGVTTFRKPISCHLYPIRVHKSETDNFHALNYDKWSLCSPACTLGKQLQLPLYQFVREAIVRKYGQEFYDELDDVARDMKGQV